MSSLRFEARGAVLDFVTVRPGVAVLGAPAQKFDLSLGEYPPVDVEYTYEFHVARTVVTSEVGGLGATHGAHGSPLVGIDWYRAMKLAAEISNEVARSLPPGLVIRLPTEAECERFIRLDAPWLESPSDDRCERILRHAWCAENSGGQLKPVCQRAAGALGLFDALGNVATWCIDAPYEPVSRGACDVVGSDTTIRAVRGSGYGQSCRDVFPWTRSCLDAARAGSDLGLRLVLGPPVGWSAGPRFGRVQKATTGRKPDGPGGSERP